MLRKIVIVAYDRVKLMDVCGVVQAFSDARQEDGRSAYHVTVVSEAGGFVTTDTGLKLDTAPLDQAALRSVDTLLVAGFDPAIPPTSTASLRSRLSDYLDEPRRLGSICTGAFILAELGVLDGLEATTHWIVCDKLKQEYPAIKVKPDAIFITSGRLWTSAGVSAGIDMSLAMIEEDLGHLAALNVARGLVLFLKRPGGQSQFSVELRQQLRDARGRFDDLHDWIRSNLDADLSVLRLAEVARMSPRNFARVYLRETGESPGRAVERLRTEAARRLLEAAHEPIKVVARRTGFGDDERMRRAFVRAYGVSPQDYRTRFGYLKN
ncbi:GlxA family transcriptional regulator [Telmatospirillum siberiense]|uniref:AraC family transcriptional regulator n=1 Tax=Telmatospirillum siberiense TaxID=382514 RepID=A0A2N3PRH3_9PROT|nr:helix-turn-helix domain-containing protein [Telmatospirillum siberiense]PKU22999.1 AraC family transcriptional regulator [Telmatospirillum siberiense]